MNELNALAITPGPAVLSLKSRLDSERSDTMSRYWWTTAVVWLVSSLGAISVDADEPRKVGLPVAERVRVALESPVKFTVEDGTTIDELVATVEQEFDIPVFIDSKAMEEAAITTDSPIQVDGNYRGLRLKSVLNLLLRSIDVTWVVRDDVLQITTRTAADLYLETRVYDVTDLFAPEAPRHPEDLTELLMSVIAPTTWSDVGGAGAIKWFNVGGTVVLVISQTMMAHDDIVDLLTNLRSVPKRPADPALTEMIKKKHRMNDQADFDNRPIEVPAVQPDSARDEVVAANTQLAVDLYGKLRERPGNLFVSPYSISTAMAMTYAGARGTTADEMAATMHWQMPQDELHTGFASLDKTLKRLDDAKVCVLRSANRLWFRPEVKFRDEFLVTAKDFYRCQPDTIDFRQPECVKTINNWVKEQTDGQIDSVLSAPPGDETWLLLMNAIHFHGKWAEPFLAAKTRPLPFDGVKRVEVPLMYQVDHCGYASLSGGVEVLKKPYVGKALSMVVVLPPAERDSLAKLEESLDAPSIERWLTAPINQSVHVLLPKFKMEDTRDLDKVLPEMGMKLAFLQREADFSGIGPEKYPPIFVQRVIHKAVIDLDEEGTKASALTGTFGGMGGMAPDRKPIFAANRPFLFFIVDERTKCVLFLGRVAELPGRPFTGEMPSLESLVPGGVSRDVKPRGGSGMF